jgi:hypothetical protein
MQDKIDQSNTLSIALKDACNKLEIIEGATNKFLKNILKDNFGGILFYDKSCKQFDFWESIPNLDKIKVLSNLQTIIQDLKANGVIQIDFVTYIEYGNCSNNCCSTILYHTKSFKYYSDDFNSSFSMLNLEMQDSEGLFLHQYPPGINFDMIDNICYYDNSLFREYQ